MNALLPHPPAERLARIVQGVVEALAAQQLTGGLVGPLLILVCSRMRRAAARILLLVAQFQAGTLRLRPSRKAAPPAPKQAETPPKHRLPRVFGWLLRQSRVSFGRSQLSHLLSQPDMAELIAAIPPVAHHLRPICRILGVTPPPGLFPPRRRRKPADTTTPQAAGRRKPACRAAPAATPRPPSPPRPRRAAPSRGTPATAIGPPGPA